MVAQDKTRWWGGDYVINLPKLCVVVVEIPDGVGDNFIH